MKHIFLTGNVQVGKSTILRRLLEDHPEIKTGGFRTVSGPVKGRTEGDGVYMAPADRDTPLNSDNLLFERWGEKGARQFRVYTEIFDTLGVSLLKNADGCGVILMDEIGFSERDALRFQKAILDRLDGEIPVLGVVQRWEGEFLETVRSHKNIKLITVTVENREAVVNELLERKQLWQAAKL